MSRTIAENTEYALQSIFEQAAEAESGVILYPCPPSRAVYLYNMAIALRVESTVAACLMFDPDDPRWGIGSYSHFRVLATDEGLFVARTTTPVINGTEQLIKCAVSGRPFTLNCGTLEKAQSKISTLSTQLQRLKPKYDNLNFSGIRIERDSKLPFVLHVYNIAKAGVQVKEIPKDRIQQVLDQMSSSSDDDAPTLSTGDS